MDFHKNCRQRAPRLSMYDTGRLSYWTRGWNGDNTRAVTDRVLTLKPEESVTLFETSGNGYMTYFSLLCETTRPDARIQIFTDHGDIPDIDQTLSGFFLTGLEGKEVRNMESGRILSRSGNGEFLYRGLFVPYCGGARIEIVNTGEIPLKCELSVQFCETHPAYYGRYSRAFGATVSGRSRVWGEEIVLFERTGCGCLHSLQMSLKNPLTLGQFMEGNIEIYLDHNSLPEYQSTGTEEFFMGGVYFVNLHSSAYTGCTRTFNDGSENPDHIVSAFRLFNEDPICYTRHIRVVWHHGQPRQGAVKGPTDYTFSAIFYEDAADQSAPAVTPSTALNALDLTDGDRCRRVAHGECFHRRLTKEDTLLASLAGEGEIEWISLSVRSEDVCSRARIYIETDGRKTDAVDLQAFFCQLPGDDENAGETTGRTGRTTYYRKCRIPFRNGLKIHVLYDGETEAEGYLEYREGLPSAIAWFHMKEIVLQPDSATFMLPLADRDTQGIVESIFLRSPSRPSDVCFLHAADRDDRPLLVERLSSLFLCPPGFDCADSVNSLCGVSEEIDGEGFGAFRYFPNRTFAFSNGLSMELIRPSREGLTLTVFYYTKECRSELDFSPAPQDISNRINRFDSIADYEMRCYNPVEDKDGALEAGETKLLFEDFSAGCLKCLRFGTPPDGKALHDSRLRIYLNDSETPQFDTTLGRFCSAEFEDPLYWSATRSMARLSKKDGMLAWGMRQHSSFFRYINLPYQTGIRVFMTAPADHGVTGFHNVYYAAARGSTAVFVGYEQAAMVSEEQSLKPRERIVLGRCESTALLTSIQLMLSCEGGEDYLNSLLSFSAGGAVLSEVPLYQYFFGAPPGEETRAIGEYTAEWKRQLTAENGYYSAAENGWPCRKADSPCRSVLYRLLDDTPVLFPGAGEITLENRSDSTIHVRSDVIFRCEA